MQMKHQVTADEFWGNMSRESMFEVVRVILAGGKTVGRPHYDPPVPFATFREVAVALGLEPEAIGECLARNRNLDGFEFVNYFDAPRDHQPRLAGIALLKWPELPAAVEEPPPVPAVRVRRVGRKR